MTHWPKSRWTHAGIAFLAATILAVTVFRLTEGHQFAYYAKTYPHDGLDGFGAYMEALTAGAATELLGFIVIFFLQIAFVSPTKPEE